MLHVSKQRPSGILLWKVPLHVLTVWFCSICACLVDLKAFCEFARSSAERSARMFSEPQYQGRTYSNVSSYKVQLSVKIGVLKKPERDTVVAVCQSVPCQHSRTKRKSLQEDLAGDNGPAGPRCCLVLAVAFDSGNNDPHNYSLFHCTNQIP